MTTPVRKFRAGSISCALWKNDANVNGKQMELLRATVERSYKDSKGNWQSSGSFGRNDIPMVIYCLTKAFSAMVEESSSKPESPAVEEEMVE